MVGGVCYEIRIDGNDIILFVEGEDIEAGERMKVRARQALGVSGQYISNVATGRTEVTPALVGRVFVVFGAGAAAPFRAAVLASAACRFGVQ